MQFLQNNKYYFDCYDLRTIEECLDWYFRLKEGMQKKRSEVPDMTDETFSKDVHKTVSYTINVIKIQRYKHKAETIREWMDRDRKIQERYENATPPEDIYCTECYSTTKVTSKDLIGAYDENSKVMFMFACVKCNKRQALYENGTEWLYEPPKCPKCNVALTHDIKYAKDTLTTIYACPSCSYESTDIHDFKRSEENRKKKEERDSKLLAEHRKTFCLDDIEGPKAVLNLDNIARFVDQMKEKEKKNKDPIYQKARQLKSLKIGQLKELLERAMKEEAYQDLAFAKPELGQYVIIDFTVNDMNIERSELDSKKTLKKLIMNALEDTNWRLMSEGIQYRLGILSGRLKAYEKEEDKILLV